MSIVTYDYIPQTNTPMKNTRHRIWLIGLIAVLLAACSQEGPSLLRPDKEYSVLPPEPTSLQPSELAQVLSDAKIPDKIWKELHDTIKSRIEEGDDEFINFSKAITDPMGSDNNHPPRMKTRTPAGCCPMFREYLTRYLASTLHENPITVCSTNSISELDEFMRLLEESNLEIYWPYSEDWDPDKEINITYWNAPTELQDKVSKDALLAQKYPVTTIESDTEVDDADFISGNTIVIRNLSEFYSNDTHLLRPSFIDHGTEDGGGYHMGKPI